MNSDLLPRDKKVRLAYYRGLIEESKPDVTLSKYNKGSVLTYNREEEY